MTSGARIKSVRNQKRIRQKELANHLHASFQTISQWENDENEPDVSSLIELSKVFGCSLDALVGENEEQEKKEDKSEETKEDESSKQEGDAPAPQTIIIHQKEMHVCEKCKKTFRKMISRCAQFALATLERGVRRTIAKLIIVRLASMKSSRKKRRPKFEAICSGCTAAKCSPLDGGIVGTAVALINFLCVFLINETCKASIHPGLAVLYSFLMGYGILRRSIASSPTLI